METEIMGNTQNNSEMNLPPSEKNNEQYHKWIDDIYKEIRDVYLKTNEHHINVLKLLDKFLEKFRQYIQRKQGYSSRMHDYHLVRETNRLMFLIRDLFSERNNRDYLMKTSEILGGCTFLWLRYHSLEDEQYNETHIEKILNCYAIHLQSTTDESFLLKIITHTLYVCKKLPKIFYKILEMHLKRRVQRKGRRNLEVKEDQLYILYIIAFKLWDRLQPDGENKINIAKYANGYMKPMNSLLSNPRYAPNLPKITLEDVKSGRATGIIISSLPPSKLLKLAEAVVKEDWLRGIDITAPITVDLSIDDDVNRNEQAVESDRTLISVNTEIRNLSLDDKQNNLSKELWWVKILQKQALKNMNTSGKESYRVVEVIDLDDEDVHNCDSISNTNVEMEVPNQSKATQSKEADNAKKTGQKQTSSEENIQSAPQLQEPEKHKTNSNASEKTCKRNGTTQENNHNCATILIEKNESEDSQMRDSGEVNPCDTVTVTTGKEIDVIKKSPQVEVLKTRRQNAQESRNEIKSIEEKPKSHPNQLINIEKNQMASKSEIIKQNIQLTQVEPMETGTDEEASEISESKELQTERQQVKQPKIVKTDRRRSVLKEKPISNLKACPKLEVNDTPIESISKKGNHSADLPQEKSDLNKDLNKLGLQSKEISRINNNRQLKNTTPLVKRAMELFEETSEDDEITSIICMEETKAKSPIVISESDGSEGVIPKTAEDKNNDGKKNLKSCSPLKSNDENDLKNISDGQIDSRHEKSIHIIDTALNSSEESLQINESPDDERAIDDTISISSIVEESENYDTIDPKIDDIHIEKISPVVNVKTSKYKKNKSDGSVLFSVSTSRKLSPPRKVEKYKEICKEKSPQKDRVVFSTSTTTAKIRSASPNYTFIPAPDLDHDEIKSPPVESFSKSDTDEFKKIFNNSNHLNTHHHEKEATTENNAETEERHEHTVENLISKTTNQVTKRSILTKTDGNIQNENLSTSNIKRKAVSFATVTQDKPQIILTRSPNLDSTIIERKTYDSPLTIQNEPQNWRSSINNSPPLSNQQDRTSQDQELELLSTSDVNSLGSSSPPPMKESGMTQNMFQFENDTQLSVFNDDAVGNNTEVLPNKSCESDNNLVSATDLSISSKTLKVKTDLMSSDSELNNAEEDSINMIWQLITEHCDNKSGEKKLQNSLPLKKRRKLSRDSNSFVEVNCKETRDKKAFDYYDKQIAYPAERCMSILQFLDISQCQTAFFVNNNSSIAIINNSPSQQTILTGGNGFNVIAQQQKGNSSTTNTNVYPNIPVQRDMNEEVPATENINGNVFQCNQASNKQNNFEYIINPERSYNACNMGNSNSETQSELNNFDYTLNSNYPTQTTQRNVIHNQPMDATLDLSNLNYNVNSNRAESQGLSGHNNISAIDINKFNYSQNSVNASQTMQNNILEAALHKEKYNSPNNTHFMQENQQRKNTYVQSPNEINKMGWRQMPDEPDSNQQKNIVQNSQLANDIQKYNYPLNNVIAAQNQRKNNQSASANMNDYSNFTLNPNIPVNSIQTIAQNIQNQQQQRVNNFNCSLNANIESQRGIAQNMQNSDQKFNYSVNINRHIQNSQPNVDYKPQTCDLRSAVNSPQNLSQLSMETSKRTGNIQNIIEQSAQMNKYNELMNTVVNSPNTLGNINQNIDVSLARRPIHPVMSTQNAYFAVNDFIASNMSEDTEARSSKVNNDRVTPSNMNQMSNSVNGNCFQYQNQNRVENKKNETVSSPLNKKGHDIPESKGKKNFKLARELASIEEDQKLAKQQLLGVNMNHYNLKYEHISNYVHNNKINFAKKRALLHDEEDHSFLKKSDHESERYLPDNTKKQIKLQKKGEESRGKPRKSKNNLTDRITRSSNRTWPVNYKDDELTERISHQERNKEDSNTAEDVTSEDDGKTSPLKESLLDLEKGLPELNKMLVPQDQFATPTQLVCNLIKNTSISPSVESVSRRVSFTRERTISPSLKNVEVLDKISTIQQPYQSLSDFDRYLVGIKRANTPKPNESPRGPVNLTVDRNQILKPDQSSPSEPLPTISNIIRRSGTPLSSIKANESQDKVESYRFKNNFERITCKDPKLKKKVVVELKNYTSSELKKIMNINRRRSVSESLSIENSDIENNRRSLSASFRENQIVNTPKTKTVASSTSPLASPTRYKISPSKIVIKFSPPREPTLLLRDKSTDVNGLRPIYIRKRRSSVVPEIVVQVFRDKNKRHLNPCVMLKKLDLNALDSHMNEKEKHKHKKKDKSRRKSKCRRTSEDEDEDDMTDNSISEKYCTRRSSGRTPYNWEKTKNHKYAVNGLPSQSETEFDETQNEISEIDLLYPSHKRRRSRSKSGSRSRSRSRSKSKSKSRKRRDSKIEFSETDLFLSLERGRSRSRSKSKSRGRSKSKDTQTDYSDVDSTPSKKRKSKSGKKTPTHNKKTIDLLVEDDHDKTSSPLHFYHEFGYVSSDEETLSTKRHRHLKSKEIDGELENLNVRDKSTSPITLPFDLSRPLSSPSLSEDERSTSGSPTRLNNSTSRVRRISNIDINFDRTHQKSFKEFSDQFSTLPKSKFNSAQVIRNENESDSIQESPLFILADDTFMGESCIDGESTRKNGKISSKYSNSSSDSSDLAILPKRRKLLQAPAHYDENDPVSPEKLSPTAEIDKRLQSKYTSDKKKRKSSSSIKSDTAETRSSGSMSPEITVNINKAKTYSKSNLVQNVFVPAELEMNFENPSRVATSVQSRKDLNYNGNSIRMQLQGPIVQNNESVIAINKFAKNSADATQSIQNNVLETAFHKGNNTNFMQENKQRNINDIQNSQPNVDYIFQTCDLRCAGNFPQNLS